MDIRTERRLSNNKTLMSDANPVKMRTSRHLFFFSCIFALSFFCYVAAALGSWPLWFLTKRCEPWHARCFPSRDASDGLIAATCVKVNGDRFGYTRGQTVATRFPHRRDRPHRDWMTKYVGGTHTRFQRIKRPPLLWRPYLTRFVSPFAATYITNLVEFIWFSFVYNNNKKGKHALLRLWFGFVCIRSFCVLSGIFFQGHSSL